MRISEKSREQLAASGATRRELGLPRGGREGGSTAGGRADAAAAAAAAGLLPLLLPRVRLLPPLLCAPDPAAAPARASSSLPKICNLRAGPAHALTSPLPEQPDTRRRPDPAPFVNPTPPDPGRAGCG